jgi:hypothetical protein
MKQVQISFRRKDLTEELKKMHFFHPNPFSKIKPSLLYACTKPWTLFRGSAGRKNRKITGQGN